RLLLGLVPPVALAGLGLRRDGHGVRLPVIGVRLRPVVGGRHMLLVEALLLALPAGLREVPGAAAVRLALHRGQPVRGPALAAVLRGVAGRALVAPVPPPRLRAGPRPLDRGRRRARRPRRERRRAVPGARGGGLGGAQ